MFLGVNIDHIATVRQARRAPGPDPVQAATLAEMGGADGITVHLRTDRRHINERDVELLRDGREAVGVSVGMPKRQPDQDSTQRDEIDDLFDGLDAMDL